MGLTHGDLGRSLLTERPVNDDIRDTFAATFELVLATITLAFIFGVPLGVAAARWKDKWPDNLVRLIAILSAVTPSFFAGAAAADPRRLRAAHPADHRSHPPMASISAPTSPA